MICDKTELALLALPADMNCLVVETRTPVIAQGAAIIAAKYRIIRFKGRAMIEVHEHYSHFVPLTREHFTQIARSLLGWIKQSHLNDVFEHVIEAAQSQMAGELAATSNDTVR